MCATLDILTSVTVTGSHSCHAGPQPLPWPSIVSSSEIFQFNYLNILHEKHPIETWQPIGKNVWRWHSLLLYARCFTVGTDERDELCIENMRCIRVRIWDVTGNQIPGRLPAAGRVSAAGCSGRSAGGSAAPGTAASSASTQSVWYVRRTRIKYTRHILQRALTGIL